ncbi:MAG: formylglycine-generating enzyme family protein [Deltaproteobacteria bacterium]
MLALLAAVTVAQPLFAQRPERPAVSPPAPDRVTIPAGEFVMGSDTLGERDERPAHRVTLPAYAIDRTEVTRGSYQRCSRAGVCEDAWIPMPTFRDPAQPVVAITWFAARNYCRWAGGRLPTEAEWEKAARGTDGRIYPWGNEPPTPERAVYHLRMNVGHPAAVGTHPAGDSPYGLHDMAGNVWEWTESVYDPYAYTRPGSTATCESALATFADLRRRGDQSFTGAMGIPTLCQRVLRGGAWNYWPGGLRSSNRVHHEPTGHYPVSGFRCAADVAQ